MNIFQSNIVLLTSTDLPLSFYLYIIQFPRGPIHDNHYKINYRYSVTIERKKFK